MSESQFKAEVRKDFSLRYRGRGVLWTNDTGYAESHHDPFGGPGAGDLIGLLCGRWIEIETKTLIGKARSLQLIRRKLVRDRGGIYIEARTLEQIHAVLDEIDQPNGAMREELGNGLQRVSK